MNVYPGQFSECRSLDVIRGGMKPRASDACLRCFPVSGGNVLRVEEPALTDPEVTHDH